MCRNRRPGCAMVCDSTIGRHRETYRGSRCVRKVALADLPADILSHGSTSGDMQISVHHSDSQCKKKTRSANRVRTVASGRMFNKAM